MPPQVVVALRRAKRGLVPVLYWIALAAAENALLALEPIKRTVPTTRTRITANITAYSAISCPDSSDQSLRSSLDIPSSCVGLLESACGTCCWPLSCRLELEMSNGERLVYPS